MSILSMVDVNEVASMIKSMRSTRKIKKGSLYSQKYTNSTFNFIEYRESRVDPISDQCYGFVENDERAFIVPYTWCSFTGERKGPDPYGPLYFSPENLATYFHSSRLNNIYIDHGNGDFNLGPAIGMGPDFNIISRGPHPDWYLYRLPISTCYVPSNKEGINIAPKLTRDEIVSISNKIRDFWPECKVRNIVEVYDTWHDVVNSTAPIDSVLKELNGETINGIKIDKSCLTPEAISYLRERASIVSVEKLRDL